jgi:hypothetical protein
MNLSPAVHDVTHSEFSTPPVEGCGPHPHPSSAKKIFILYDLLWVIFRPWRTGSRRPLDLGEPTSLTWLATSEKCQSRIMAATISLFDSFVGESESVRNLQAERLGSPQVYDEIFASDSNRAYLPRSGSLQ